LTCLLRLLCTAILTVWSCRCGACYLRPLRIGMFITRFRSDLLSSLILDKGSIVRTFISCAACAHAASFTVHSQVSQAKTPLAVDCKGKFSFTPTGLGPPGAQAHDSVLQHTSKIHGNLQSRPQKYIRVLKILWLRTPWNRPCFRHSPGVRQNLASQLADPS
jgi:hypothetical protein